MGGIWSAEQIPYGTKTIQISPTAPLKICLKIAWSWLAVRTEKPSKLEPDDELVNALRSVKHSTTSGLLSSVHMAFYTHKHTHTKKGTSISKSNIVPLFSKWRKIWMI